MSEIVTTDVEDMDAEACFYLDPLPAGFVGMIVGGCIYLLLVMFCDRAYWIAKDDDLTSFILMVLVLAPVTLIFVSVAACVNALACAIADRDYQPVAEALTE